MSGNSVAEPDVTGFESVKSLEEVSEPITNLTQRGGYEYSRDHQDKLLLIPENPCPPGYDQIPEEALKGMWRQR